MRASPAQKVYENHKSGEGASGRKIRIFVTKILIKQLKFGLCGLIAPPERTHAKNETPPKHAGKKGYFGVRSRVESIQNPREREKNSDSHHQFTAKQQSLASASSKLHRTHAKAKLCQNHARKKGSFLGAPPAQKVYENHKSGEGASGRKTRIFVTKILIKQLKFGLCGLIATPERTHAKTELRQKHARKKGSFGACPRLKTKQEPRERRRREREKNSGFHIQVADKTTEIWPLWAENYALCT